MKSLRIVLTTAIAVLIAVVAMRSRARQGERKKSGPKLSLVTQTMLRIDRIKSAVEGLD